MNLKTLLFVAAIALGLLAIAIQPWGVRPDPKGTNDDWAYDASQNHDDAVPYSNLMMSQGPAKFQSALPAVGAEAELGFAVGGAKDVGNFRKNVEEGFLPLPSDLTYEGLIYDYAFDTGQLAPCRQLFCPSYSAAVSRDPLSGRLGYYLAVGLNSGLSQKDFQRKPLNLVIVLDISGSMDAPFDRYYYDGPDNDPDAGKSKMRLAAEAVVALLDHLGPDDRLGVVLFNSQAYLGKPLSLVGLTDMDAIAQHLLAVSANSGTNMEAGYQMGRGLFGGLEGVDSAGYESRIVFLTDAMPNLGDTSEGGLLGQVRAAEAKGIYTTFIGVGVDFNTTLVESITKIRGANYHSVHSAKAFKARMDEGFDYMVTPLVFDLRLSLAAQGFEIEKVYGSPEADQATGTLMAINTLFPSKREDGQTQGGLVLLKLRKAEGANPRLTLQVSYQDRNGTPAEVETQVVFPDAQADAYDNLGIRKGVLLARYVDLIQNWLIDERRAEAQPYAFAPSASVEAGIPTPQPEWLGRWERRSQPLHVMAAYTPLLTTFKAYFEAEASGCNDPTLSQETRLLDRVLAAGA